MKAGGRTAGPSTSFASLRSGRDDRVRAGTRNHCQSRAVKANDQRRTANDNRPTTAQKIKAAGWSPSFKMPWPQNSRASRPRPQRAEVLLAGCFTCCLLRVHGGDLLQQCIYAAPGFKGRVDRVMALAVRVRDQHLGFRMRLLDHIRQVM